MKSDNRVPLIVPFRTFLGPSIRMATGAKGIPQGPHAARERGIRARPASFFPRRWPTPLFIWVVFSLALASPIVCGGDLPDESSAPWIPLFDGTSLEGWQAPKLSESWSVRDGCLSAKGQRSDLFYVGSVSHHDFRNFELRLEVRVSRDADSGIYFHTKLTDGGDPGQRYEIQIRGPSRHTDGQRAAAQTGSLLPARPLYKAWVDEDRWMTIRVRVVHGRIAVWVNGRPTVDYVQNNVVDERLDAALPRLSSGTFALQHTGPDGRVDFRAIAVRVLPDSASMNDWPRASGVGFGVTSDQMTRLAKDGIPLVDYHVHLRGGMTVDKAMQRQAVTGINVGVLRNLGNGWPLETDDQLRTFLDEVADQPVFVGVQVNDRNWYTKHDRSLLQRLDYILGDTMIMPMPDDDSPPVKLWMADQYTIEDPEAWMERYMRHNLRVVAEPITILANPTWLPPAVADQYDELWTDDRMRTLIQAAVDHHVALEINAKSGLPSDRFIRMAKDMGAKFSFGTNNFDDRPTDMARCLEVIRRFRLKPEDIYVP